MQNRSMMKKRPFSQSSPSFFRCSDILLIDHLFVSPTWYVVHTNAWLSNWNFLYVGSFIECVQGIKWVRQEIMTRWRYRQIGWGHRIWEPIESQTILKTRLRIRIYWWKVSKGVIHNCNVVVNIWFLWKNCFAARWRAKTADGVVGPSPTIDVTLPGRL